MCVVGEEPIDHLTVLAAAEKQMLAFRARLEALVGGMSIRRCSGLLSSRPESGGRVLLRGRALLAALREMDSSLAEDILEACGAWMNATGCLRLICCL